MSNAGKMGAGAAWGIALAGSAVGAAAGGFIPGIVGWLVALAIIGGAGWATVHMTQASAGKGILAFLAGGAVSAIVSYFIYKMQMGDVGAKIAEGAKSTGNAQVDAQMAQLSGAAGGALATGAAALVAFFGFLRTFLVGMIGCFIGNATKKSAGGSSAVAKAA